MVVLSFCFSIGLTSIPIQSNFFRFEQIDPSIQFIFLHFQFKFDFEFYCNCFHIDSVQDWLKIHFKSIQ